MFDCNWLIIPLGGTTPPNGGVYNPGNLNPYIYCYQNPVAYVDPNGKQVSDLKKDLLEWWNGVSPWSRASKRMSGVSERDEVMQRNATIMRTVGNAGKHAATKEVGHTALDLIGTVEPTPFADTTNAIWYAFEGNYKYAALSGIAIIPYVGDAGKIGKYGVKALNFATTLNSKYSNMDWKNIEDLVDKILTKSKDLNFLICELKKNNVSQGQTHFILSRKLKNVYSFHEIGEKIEIGRASCRERVSSPV